MCLLQIMNVRCVYSSVVVCTDGVMLFAVVLSSFSVDVMCFGSKHQGTLAGGVCTGGVHTGCAVSHVCVLSFIGGVLTGGVVVSCVGMVSVTASGRLVKVLAFIVRVEVYASSDGSKCGVSRKEQRTGELSGLIKYPVSPVLGVVWSQVVQSMC